MALTKYDKSFDEMLEGKNFQEEDAIKFLAKDFTDDELEKLSVQELINLFTKAFVLICVQKNEIGLLHKKLSDQLETLLKHYKIYPDLIQAGKSEADFNLIKAEADLKNHQSAGFAALLRKLPEIRKKSHKKAASSGGHNRAQNDPKHQAVERIKAAYLLKWETGYRFPRGQLSKFYKEMAKNEASSEIEETSIKNAIEDYRKELGHTIKQKQSI